MAASPTARRAPVAPARARGAAVRRRWHRPRPAAAQVRPAHSQEDEGRRARRCPVRPGATTASTSWRSLISADARPRRSRRAADGVGPGQPPWSCRAHRHRHLAVAAQRPRGAIVAVDGSTPTTCWRPTTSCSRRARRRVPGCTERERRRAATEEATRSEHPAQEDHRDILLAPVVRRRATACSTRTSTPSWCRTRTRPRSRSRSRRCSTSR